MMPPTPGVRPVQAFSLSPEGKQLPEGAVRGYPVAGFVFAARDPHDMIPDRRHSAGVESL